MTKTVPVKCREATSDDWPAWSRMWFAYLRFYETERPAAQFELTWSRIQSHEEPMHCIVAVSGEDHVGLVNFLYHRSFWDDEPRCYLQDLFVEPSSRGQGIGAALIDEVAAHARSSGASALYWLTASDNDRARRLYDHVSILTPFIKYGYPLDSEQGGS